MALDTGDSTLGAAVGIAFAPADHDGDARTLLRQAEQAADNAHLTDTFAFGVFDPDQHAVMMKRLQQESDLRLALANDGFELHYQPEYDATTGRWVAAEALLRWRVGDELRTAAEFIGTAEASGLILALGTWVVHRACSDASAWPPCPDGTRAAVRVNVSARQFDAPGLVDDVASALRLSGLDPSRLCLEITETTLMTDVARAQQVLEAITGTGVKMAIDDFGTGYGSLVYLKNLPANALKIDRAFVSGLPDDRVSTAIVAAVAGLATALDIDVIAEGVETLPQQQALQAAGVCRMQGWLYARAMPQAALCAVLAADAPAFG
jgi:EAL domain-containing protein (putative c-di-GMP-specific phosphodiesterase class I)